MHEKESLRDRSGRSGEEKRRGRRKMNLEWKESLREQMKRQALDAPGCEETLLCLQMPPETSEGKKGGSLAPKEE